LQVSSLILSQEPAFITATQLMAIMAIRLMGGAIQDVQQAMEIR
jgi:hypothetical protein